MDQLFCAEEVNNFFLNQARYFIKTWILFHFAAHDQNFFRDKSAQPCDMAVLQRYSNVKSTYSSVFSFSHLTLVLVRVSVKNRHVGTVI